MALRTFEARTQSRDHQARVWWDEDRGWFMFSVIDGDRQLVAAGGADGELDSLDKLISASVAQLDWESDIDLARDLRVLELSSFPNSVQDILLRVFV